MQRRGGTLKVTAAVLRDRGTFGGRGPVRPSDPVSSPSFVFSSLSDSCLSRLLTCFSPPPKKKPILHTSLFLPLVFPLFFFPLFILFPPPLTPISFFLICLFFCFILIRATG